MQNCRMGKNFRQSSNAVFGDGTEGIAVSLRETGARRGKKLRARKRPEEGEEESIPHRPRPSIMHGKHSDRLTRSRKKKASRSSAVK